MKMIIEKNAVSFLFGVLMLCAFHLPASVGSVIQAIKDSRAIPVLTTGENARQVTVTRNWHGDICSTIIKNNSNEPVNLREVVLFSAAKLFSGPTPFYGEGFQLLSQSNGTLEKPHDLGSFTDRGHYKLKEPDGYRVVYNLLMLDSPEGQHYLLGFTSSNRFIGKFYLSADTVKVVMDMENIEIAPGESLALEDFYLKRGVDRNGLFADFAIAIEKNHPRLKIPLPTGWCSWYCFGPEVTATDIRSNLKAIREQVPKLRYIQIDDGYQVNMGDWLEIGNSFGGNITDVLLNIKNEGFEPAIWVAPFICDSNSVIYKEHKQWLVKDKTGAPLRSDKVGFGGWRLAPWFVLDGTHPEVQQHFEYIFKTMREKWGCTYFKLDANYWGCIPDAQYYRKNATRTEAYREGMKAILKGTGDAFVLGCNQPMWPSLGLIHGSRSSMDVSKSWQEISSTGRENLFRSWQNGRLWWNDPDCLLLTDALPDNLVSFHSALLYATGGMLLSGDNIPSLTPQRIEILKKMADVTGVAADFNSDAFEYGWVTQGKKKRLVVLNWHDTPMNFTIPIKGKVKLIGLFDAEQKGKFRKNIILNDFPPHSGAVYVVE